MAKFFKNNLFLLGGGGLILTFAAVFFACSMPVGLGELVNTEKPVISTPPDGLGPGAFLHGEENRIDLDVENSLGFRIETVYMDVWYNDEDGVEQYFGRIYAQEDNNGWFVNIDTTDLPDGKIRTQVTAIDATGNRSTTTDMIYTIKNLPPQIEMSIPSLKGEDFDINPLNPKTNDSGAVFTSLRDFLETDPIYIGFDIMGLAMDNLGIKLGFPKIMIWPISGPDALDPIADFDANGIPKDPRWGTWRSTIVPNAREGITSTRFSWPMVSLIPYSSGEGGYRLPRSGEVESLPAARYAIRIWTQDLYGQDNFYPNRTDNLIIGDDGKPIHPDLHPNKNEMIINYIAADIPIINVLSIPQYYNGVGDFKVELYIASSNPIAHNGVKAWVTNMRQRPGIDSPDFAKYWTSAPLESDRYDVEWISDQGTTYNFNLTIDGQQAASWPRPNDASEAVFYVFFEAIDNMDKKSPPGTFRTFNFDTMIPTVTFDRPIGIGLSDAAIPRSGQNDTRGSMEGGSYVMFYPTNNPTITSNMPRWVTGRITVGGSNLDEFGLSRIHYRIGKMPVSDDASESERIAAYTNEDNWQDTFLHTAYPADNWKGSIFAWSYEENFNNYKIMYPDKIQEHTELTAIPAWTAAYGNNAFYDTVGKTRFYLPFYVRVTDAAGNFRITHYKLCIDPDLDYPLVQITQPADNSLLGGEIRMSGTANDDTFVHSVQVRIKKYGTGLMGTGLENIERSDEKGTFKYYIPTSPVPSRPYVDYPNFPTYDNNNDKEGWFRADVRTPDAVVGWTSIINRDGGLNPEHGDKTVDVKIEIRAVDNDNIDRTVPKMVGPSEVLNVQFSTGVPTIGTPLIKIVDSTKNPDRCNHLASTPSCTICRDYDPDITVAQFFSALIEVADDEGLSYIKARVGNIEYTLLDGDSVKQYNDVTISDQYGAPLPAQGLNNRIARRITVDIDTRNGAFATSSGYMDIEIEVSDNNETPLTAKSTFVIGVDNFYPRAVIETTTNASTTSFDLSGVAYDYGTGSGQINRMERMLVYFEDARIEYQGTTRFVVGTGTFRNPRGMAIGVSSEGSDVFYDKAIYTQGENASVTSGWRYNPQMETYHNVKVQNPPAGSSYYGATFENFPVIRLVNKGSNIGTIWESPHAMVIDRQELAANIDSDEDSTYGEAWDGRVDKIWQARMNTLGPDPANADPAMRFPYHRGFKDGPLMVHYIFMDNAGNATHYQKDIFIENKRPEIRYINLGTNVKGSTASVPWQDISNPGDFMKVRFPVESTAAGNRIVTFEDTMDNPFRVRGNRLALRLETRSGNNDKYYKVLYVRPDNDISAAQMRRGQVYTIISSGNTDWQRYGAVNNAVHTTFVASGPGEGNGRVVPFIEIASTPSVKITENNGNDMLNEIIFSDFSLIPDSTKTPDGDIARPPLSSRPGWPSNWGINWPERLFIIKVYDTTVALSGTPTDAQIVENQLAHAVLVALDIDNDDKKAPAIEAAPFGEKFTLRHGGNDENEADRELSSVSNYNENIVMSGGRRQGYVQYAAHNGTITPGNNKGIADISGQVIFTGKASDNQRIQNIKVKIPGYNDGNEFTAAVWNNGELGSINDPAGEWSFKLLDDRLSLEYGHTVNWEFSWDSSFVNNQVGSSTVEFSVNDFRSDAPAAVTDNLAVNIVPYISEITTRLSGMYGAAPSAFARSSTGWYPVREDEVITIRGFNLGTDGSAITSSVNIGGTVTGTAAPAGGTNITPAAVSGYRNVIELNVGTAAMSGDLTVRVNGAVNSINNRTRLLNTGVTDNNANRQNTANRVAYNWEPNIVNNNMLTNDRKIYIWSAGNISNLASLEYPHLSVSPNGTRFMAYNRTTTSIYRNTNDTEALLETSINRYLNITTAYGNNNLWYVGTSNQTAQADNSYAIHARGTSSGAANANGSNKARILNLGASTAALLPNRVRVPKIHAFDTSTTSSRVVTSYFDELNNQINFNYGVMTGTQAANTSTTNTNVLTRTGDFANHHPTAQVVAVSGSTHDGSIHTAVATLSNGVPVIAWYSPKSDSIVFSNGNAITGNNVSSTTTTAQWQSNIVVIDTGKGSYVDMAVDSANNVHLAYYDSNNGGLHYAYIPYNSGTGLPNKTAIETARVDTFLGAGTNIMINIRQENGGYRPYISYIHSSYATTRGAVRIAWPITAVTGTKYAVADNTDSGDIFLGTWEVMTVPIVSPPITPLYSTFVVTNGVPSTMTGWVKPAGINWPATYAAGNTATHNTISRTVLIGFMAGSRYEGAVLKASIPDLKY